MMSADAPEVPPATATDIGVPLPPRRQYPIRCVVARALLHPERAAGLAGEELPDELVVGVEKFRRWSGLHDPALPKHRDVVRDTTRGHDVVSDDDVAAAVLRVHFLDQLTEERGAD